MIATAIFILTYSLKVYCNETKDVSTLKALIVKSDLIIKARVLEIGQSPLFWSGYILATQQVKYETLEVLKGVYTEKYLTVEHLIYPSKDVDQEKVCLLENIFKKENFVILFLEKSEGDYYSLGNTLIATQENIDLVKSIVDE